MTILEHKKCGGKVVENIQNNETVQLNCLKCRKSWGILSDLSDIEIYVQERKLREGSMPLEISTFHMRSRLPNFVINFLFNHRLRRVLRMMDFSTGKECVGLDLGCNKGNFTQFLANRLRGITIGADISKLDLRRAKLSARLNAAYQGCNSSVSIDFVCCDMTLLPFRENSIDLVVCVSVLEHALDIETVVKEIANSIVEKGILVAGYPIETSLFNALLGIFLPSGLVIRDPRIMGKEKFDRNPETHKQSFTTIRSSLQKYFFIAQRTKSFFTFLPDQVSWYETAKMIKKSESKLEK